MNVPIYVLTIDKDGGQRKVHCADTFERLNLTPIFVQGFLLNDPHLTQEYSSWRNLLFAKRSLSAQELSVYMGHRKIWTQIVAGQNEVAFVAEDDLSIIDATAFLHVLDNAGDHKAWDILKLFDFAPKKIVASHDWHGLKIVDYKYPASSAAAYLMTREAARRLLQRKRFYRPVDEDVSWSWEFDLRVRSVSPNIVGEVSDKLGGSLIEDSRLALRRHKNRLRSIVGIFWTLVKQIRARRHLRRILTNTASFPDQPPR
jgi:GR25 family glycosyltransferase involved in LPS biosynthesis